MENQIKELNNRNEIYFYVHDLEYLVGKINHVGMPCWMYVLTKWYMLSVLFWILR